MERGGAEAEGRGVGEEESGRTGVVRGRVCGADAEVVLEAADLGGLELGERVSWARDGGEDYGEEEKVAETTHGCGNAAQLYKAPPL